jgi:hypothetical protein
MLTTIRLVYAWTGSNRSEDQLRKGARDSAEGAKPDIQDKLVSPQLRGDQKPDNRANLP